MKQICTLVVFIFCSYFSPAQLVTTIAGTAGVTGTTNATGSAARFNNPHGITSDQFGNIFIADRYNHLIRKMTPAGVVTTIAGSGSPGSADGNGSNASFNEPWGIAADTLGNLYIADTKNYKIRKIDNTGFVSTIAGTGLFGTTNGPALTARFGYSTGIAVTKDGTIIYVADHNTHVIRKIQGNVVSNLAGTIYIAGSDDGMGAAATFNHPYGIELDNSGNVIVADEWNNVIRKITPAGNVTTVAGVGISGSMDGQPSAASFNYPWDITIDSMNNIYVMDGLNHTVRKIEAVTFNVSTYAGTAGLIGNTDGSGPAARFNGAAGIVYSRTDKCLYVADTYNHTIRKISSQSSVVLNAVITGTTTVCNGDSIEITVTPSGLTNYTVYDGSVSIAASSTGILMLPPLSTGSHILTVTATDGNGATATGNTLNITVLPPVSVTITPASGTTICNGDSVLLSATTAVSYVWSDGSSAQSLYADTAGLYQVTVTNSSGCTGMASLSVTVTTPVAPIITINGNTTICPGDSVELISTSGNSYEWSDGSTAQSNYVNPGNHTVTVTDINGCKSSSSAFTVDSFSVTPPVITPSGQITIIQGDSVQLAASGGSSFTWSNGLSGNSIYANASGTYTVTITDANGCVVTSSPVEIVLISSQSMISAGGPTTFCDGYNVILNSLFTTGNQWFMNGTALPGETLQQLTVTQSGYYRVGVWQNNSWLYSDSVAVTVLPAPPMATVADVMVCTGSDAVLSATTVPGVQFTWYDSDTGGMLLGTGDSYTMQSVQSVTTLFVESEGSNGCKSIDREDVDISVMYSPLLSFTHNVQPSGGQFIVTISNTSQFDDTWFWIAGDTASGGFTSTLQDPVFTFPAPGNYPVTLISANTSGCIDSLTLILKVGLSNAMLLPTTFTPNGDGKNDIFRVRGDGFTLEEMLIYDQWGKVIFKTDASMPYWDGKADGNTVQNSTYVYRIRMTDSNNVSQELTGSVTVIK